ncbi:hypothetical protein FACS1894133_0470 [Clostridia bacterium]|nr:hypothetical protein FACS1894133_0320 [Clostridia bacterium]GHU57506.1 hypothetical protein FACS1894133_0470 [Clostridia bacterium]
MEQTAQSTLNITMDEDTRQKFSIFCADAGLTVSVAMNMFARAVLREQCIPFDIRGTVDPFYSAKNQARLAESIAQLEAGGGTVHELIEVDDD